MTNQNQTILVKELARLKTSGDKNKFIGAVSGNVVKTSSTRRVH
jgi:hypothetical protein